MVCRVHIWTRFRATQINRQFLPSAGWGWPDMGLQVHSIYLGAAEYQVPGSGGRTGLAIPGAQRLENGG